MADFDCSAADAIEKVQHVMTQKSASNSGRLNSSAPKSKTERIASSGMTRDELMKKLLADPRCRIVETSGKGFVIGGGKASTPEPRD